MIKKVIAREVLDSRGNPTVEAEVFSKDNRARAIVPSGASTGIYEALELRDKSSRYLGKGVAKAVANIALIEKKLKGKSLDSVDRMMLELDGTKNKKKLGANAILAVSMAATRLGALENKLPLYKYISRKCKTKPTIPVPFCNILNGGRHAENELAMQEFMIAPVKAKNFRAGMQAVSETYHVLKDIIIHKYGKNAANIGDEGGFAPPLKKAEDALNLIEKAMDKSGNDRSLRIALDPAASEYYNKNSLYLLHKQYTGSQLTKYYNKLIERYNIVSLEDPFDQDDFVNWNSMLKTAKAQIVGDDLLVTNPERIRLAHKEKLCNALLLKVNQIGSISEALEAARLSFKYNWKVMVSHRSGETEDSFISDLAVGLGCGQAKIGAPCRGERTAKYNQFVRIEEESKLKYARF